MGKLIKVPSVPISAQRLEGHMTDKGLLIVILLTPLP